MSNKYAGIGRWHAGLMAMIVALGLLLSATASACASSVYISDAAGVLNTSRVQSEASTLGYPLSIYTLNNFNGTTSDFDQRTRSHITQPNMLVIAIDTVHKHVTIDGGSQVPLSNSQYSDAINAFRSNYNGGDYTGATIAAIGSLSTSLRAAPAGSGSNGGNVPAPASGGGAWLGTFLLIGLLVIVGLAVFAFIRRRRGLFNQPYNPPYNEPYNQYNQPPYNQYNQPPYNQGYPPNYGPGARPGVNPWVAGGLGAAAGGLLGYELGRQQGEEEGERQDMGNNGGNFDNSGSGGDFGGGASGDFGGGGGGDFGGGGGGDFGGGSSGSF
ncbi:MAG: hypothetical protein JO183_03960 [Ktedonobacteraceae bacterium]|nr:hypothetical protein [Ktedonobacteraceae bacterium]